MLPPHAHKEATSQPRDGGAKDTKGLLDLPGGMYSIYIFSDRILTVHRDQEPDLRLYLR
jgi:hypothetical protein